MELYTERLILRPFRREDAERVFECCKNPIIGMNAGWKPHENIQESITVLAEVFLDREMMWAVTLKESGRLIGSAGLIDDPKRSNTNVKMLGYWIAEEYWYKGYATEASIKILEYAFLKAGLNLVSVYHFPDNKRSKRVIEKCGFLYEGKQRCAEISYKGDVVDNECYSITKTEFLNHK